MFSNLEKFSSATKTLIESQLGAYNGLASKGIEAVEKIFALNIAEVKASVEEFNVVAKQLLSAKAPQELFELASAQGKKNADRSAAYGRQLTETVSSINAELTKTVEAQIADANDKVTTLVNEVVKTAPAGSEKSVAILKSAMDNTNAGFEQVTKAYKKNVEMVKAHVANVTDQLTQAATKRSEA
jgi:phasin family protein